MPYYPIEGNGERLVVNDDRGKTVVDPQVANGYEIEHFEAAIETPRNRQHDELMADVWRARLKASTDADMDAMTCYTVRVE